MHTVYLMPKQILLVELNLSGWSKIITFSIVRLLQVTINHYHHPYIELMQTELHHIQALTVMSEVFRRGMVEELQLDWDCVARIFPCLDPLLLFHRNLFGALQERRQAATQPENPRNYLIRQIGDVLLQQVGEDAFRRINTHRCMVCSWSLMAFFSVLR